MTKHIHTQEKDTEREFGYAIDFVNYMQLLDEMITN
jgi:hypothetical protein